MVEDWISLWHQGLKKNSSYSNHLHMCRSDRLSDLFSKNQTSKFFSTKDNGELAVLLFIGCKFPDINEENQDEDQ